MDEDFELPHLDPEEDPNFPDDDGLLGSNLSEAEELPF